MIGIQIYTVRSLTETAEGAEMAIRALMDMGYECIQLAGGIDSVEKCAAAAKKCGMNTVGILTNIETCKQNGKRLIELSKEIGAWDIGISGTAKNLADAENLISDANEFAKCVREAGLSFSYHNHSHEFIKVENGKTIMELLLNGLDKNNIDLMPDTYWLQHGGADVRDFIKKHGERVKILHLKDMKRTPDGVTFSEVGEGNMNMSGIISTAKCAGISCFIVEQDVCDANPLESAKISLNNLKGMELE